MLTELLWVAQHVALQGVHGSTLLHISTPYLLCTHNVLVSGCSCLLICLQYNGLTADRQSTGNAQDGLRHSLGQLQPYITASLKDLGTAIQQRAIAEINDWLVCPCLCLHHI